MLWIMSMTPLMQAPPMLALPIRCDSEWDSMVRFKLLNT